MGDLREYLVWLKLAGEKTADGYRFRSNEAAADAAVAVVAQWLRDEAAELRRLASDAKDRRDDGDPNGERHYQRFLAQAVALEERANALTAGQETRTLFTSDDMIPTAAGLLAEVARLTAELRRAGTGRRRARMRRLLLREAPVHGRPYAAVRGVH